MLLSIDDAEHWLRRAWYETRHAAGCAVEIGQLVMPQTPKMQSGNDPYRDPATGGPSPDAQRAIETICRAFRFAQSYADSMIATWPIPQLAGQHPLTTLYHCAGQYGDDAWHAGYRLSPSWQLAGTIARQACTIVQKWACNSDGGGHVPNIMLRKIIEVALDEEISFDVLEEVVCKWRFRDALQDKPPTEELRLAFQAAWEIAADDFAYGLCEDVVEQSDASITTTRETA